MDPALTKLADGLWVAAAPQRFLGIPIGTRMTVVRLEGGSLLVHSPVPPLPELRSALDEIGPVSHVLAPNRFHHLHVRDFAEAYPRAAIFGAPGLPEKRKDVRFDGVLEAKAHPDWESDLRQTLVAGIPLLNEVAFLHPGSRTLLLTDLCANYGRAPSLGARLYLHLDGCYGRFGVGRLVKAVVRDRAALRASCDEMLAWDFDRVIVTHGDILETGGKEVFSSAFAWL